MILFFKGQLPFFYEKANEWKITDRAQLQCGDRLRRSVWVFNMLHQPQIRKKLFSDRIRIVAIPLMQVNY